MKWIQKTAMAWSFLGWISVGLVYGEFRLKEPIQCFLEPGVESTLVFETDSAEKERKYEIFNGSTSVGKGVLKEGACQICLPQGFYEICLETGERFGLVSLPGWRYGEGGVPRDSFFAIDGAISGLVSKKGNRRETLFQIARRCGLTMVRDRLIWSSIEPEEGNWKWNGRWENYEACRQMCQAHDLEVLEMWHDAPPWTGKVLRYPRDMRKLASSWKTIAARWESMWGALEVWNEPDISFSGHLPADQYVPILKTISWQMEQSGMKKPVVGFSSSGFPKRWLECAAGSGALDDCDIFSFHTYAKAPSMVEIYRRFHEFVNPPQRPHKKPIWITECGRPWKRGKERADVREDILSAIDIAMKGVEAKACGCARYFPFVFPYYDERESNFGMMDKNLSPMRSMGGYAQLIRVLSHQEYLGDLPIPESFPEVSRCRVFGNPENSEAVVVCYTQDVDKTWEFPLPVPCRRAERFSGERLDVEKNTVTVQDGLVYAWVSRSEIEPFLRPDERVVKMLRESTREPSGRRKTSPVVIRLEPDAEKMSPKADGYWLKAAAREGVNVQLILENLSPEPACGTLSCVHPAELAEKIAPQRLELAGNERKEVPIFLPPSERLRSGEWESIQWVWQPDEGAPEPYVFQIRGELDLETALRKYGGNPTWDFADLPRWKPSAGAHGKTNFAKIDADGLKIWQLTTEFGEGDAWTYPHFTLPEGENLAKYDGLALRVRCSQNESTLVRMFLYATPPEGKQTAYTGTPILPPDGEWHIVQVRWSDFQDYHTKFQKSFPLEAVRRISLGGNTREKSFQLEVSHVWLLPRSEQNQ
ncbi:MAG: glycosyl hydrolase [Planctomycetia bacterium]|nr:glycosyl hydrolase [Planctomycetia bacterium]